MSHIVYGRDAKQDLLNLVIMEYFWKSDIPGLRRYLTEHNIESIVFGQFGPPNDELMAVWLKGVEFGCFRHQRHLLPSTKELSIIDSWSYGVYNVKFPIVFRDCVPTHPDLYKQLDVEWLLIHDSTVIINEQIRQTGPTVDHPVYFRKFLLDILGKRIIRPGAAKFMTSSLYAMGWTKVKPQWTKADHHKTDSYFKETALTVLWMIKFHGASFRMPKDLRFYLLERLYNAHNDWVKQTIIVSNTYGSQMVEYMAVGKAKEAIASARLVHVIVNTKRPTFADFQEAYLRSHGLVAGYEWYRNHGSHAEWLVAVFLKFAIVKNLIFFNYGYREHADRLDDAGKLKVALEIEAELMDEVANGYSMMAILNNQTNLAIGNGVF